MLSYIVSLSQLCFLILDVLIFLSNLIYKEI